MQRATGKIHVGVRGIALRELHQAGCLKVRFPRTHDSSIEAVLINTSGGITDGDSLAATFSAGVGSILTVTTPAAEKIYRAISGAAPARVTLQASIGADARLDYLPQETLLFDACALDRTLDVDLHPTGRFLGVETLVFGRAHSGETLDSLRLRDSMRLRREGRLIFHDTVRLRGEVRARLAAGRAGAVATILYAGPDAAAHLAPVREALTGAEGGASSWDGMLVARLIAPDGQALRCSVVAVLGALREKPLPVLWAS